MRVRPEIKAAATSLRRHVAAHAESIGTGHYEAVVTATEPLQVDILTLDMQATDENVTIGNALQAFLASDGPLAIGDTLGLIETEAGEFVAFEVLRDA